NASTIAYTASLHDALPICAARTNGMASLTVITTEDAGYEVIDVGATDTEEHPAVVVMTTDATDDLSLFLPSSSHDTLYAIEDVVDRKSTRLNSSHVKISYA